MFRFSILLISLLAFSPFVLALPLPGRPFIGCGVEYAGRVEITPTYLKANGQSAQMAYGYGSYGFQFEYGRRFDFFSAYAGFRHAFGTENEQDYAVFRDGYYSGHSTRSGDYRWLTDRFLLGGRVWAFEHAGGAIKPLIGAGLSFGWSQRSFDNQLFGTAHHSERQKSHGTLGWFVEPGLMYKINDAWRMHLLVRIEDLGLQLGNSPHGMLQEVSTVGGASLQIGASCDINSLLP
jgi:hypothetical protein